MVSLLVDFGRVFRVENIAATAQTVIRTTFALPNTLPRRRKLFSVCGAL
jgi:hypothetical protein